MRLHKFSVVVVLFLLSLSSAKTKLEDVETDSLETSTARLAVYHIRSDTLILSGYNDVCCTTCSHCTSDDCCGYSSGTNMCYFCTNGTCCGSSSYPEQMGCCPPGFECCMDCSNSTANGGPIWGCAVTGTCDCYPSSNQCLDDVCCPTNRQCGTSCCATDEFCCLGECYKQNDDNYTCCEYSFNVFTDPIGTTCPKSQSTCCTFSGQTDCCPDNSTCCDSTSCDSNLQCCGGCNCCKECNEDGSCKQESTSSLLATVLGIAVPVAAVLGFLLCCCCVLRRMAGRKNKYKSRAARSSDSRYRTEYVPSEVIEVPLSSYSQNTPQYTNEDTKPLTAKDYFKQYTDEEFADWNPGLDMFKALIGDLNDPWYKKAFKMIMSILGIIETILYILQLKDYFQQHDYVYGSLSAASLLLFTIYTSYLTIMEVITVWENPIAALIVGALLGIFQLGHTFTLIVCYSGKGSIIRDDDVGSVLNKMELWKIAIFSMPQGSLALYLALLNVDSLDYNLNTAQTVLAILFSILTIAFSMSEYYRDHTTSKLQIILCMLYLVPMVALRFATFGIIPLTETYFLFPYLAIGVFVRYFISNAKLGDPMHDKFVKVISAVMFTFIINIDPSVAYWPVLLCATLETIIGIGVSIYYPYNRKVPFLEDNARYFIAVIIILIVLMAFFGLILRRVVLRMHEDNLVSMFYRWTLNAKERMTLRQGERPKSLQQVAQPDAFTTKTEIRRYNGDPQPSLLVNIKKKTFNNQNLANMTRQFRANPALVDILAFRADEFAKAGLYKEAIADCTFALNPYFGFRYEPVGLGFNSFNNKLILARFAVNDGSDPLIPRLLLTRASCLLELGQTDLAFEDRRRLLLACKILGNAQLLDMLQTNAFPSQTGKAHLEIDHEFMKVMADLQ